MSDGPLGCRREKPIFKYKEKSVKNEIQRQQRKKKGRFCSADSVHLVIFLLTEFGLLDSNAKHSKSTSSHPILSLPSQSAAFVDAPCGEKGIK